MQWRAFLGVLILSAVMGCLYFFAFSYMYTYMVTELNINKAVAYYISILQTGIACVAYPILGSIADRAGKQKISVIGCMLIIPICFFVIQTTNITVYIICSLLLIVCHAAVVSGIACLSTEVFFDKWKMTASGASYNIGAIVAGFFPMLAQFGIDFGGKNLLIGILITVSVMGLVGHYLVRISNGHKLIS